MKTFSVLGAIAAFSFIGQTIAAPTAFAVVKRDDLKVEEDLVTVLVRKSDLEDRGLGTMWYGSPVWAPGAGGRPIRVRETESKA